MSQILVRNLDRKVVRALKARAARKGRSLQTEVKSILEQAASEAKLDPAAAKRLALRIQKLIGKRPLPDSTRIIREARDSRGDPGRWV